MFGVQLYKNNARPLLSSILSVLNLDWLQHARSVCGVYEYLISEGEIKLLQTMHLPRDSGLSTKHNKASRNKTMPAAHANVPRFPGMHSLLARNECNWIDRV